MIIRKLFKFEAAHIVRDCSTERCKKSIHGHSFKVEVFLRSDQLDRAGMVMDFSLLKPVVGKFIDCFDHTYMFWSEESDEFKQKIQSLSDRWIELPFSPSAEYLSLMFHFWIQRIIDNTEFSNGEGRIQVKCIRVHETDTGYAETECDEALVKNMCRFPLESYRFSDTIRKESLDDIYQSLAHK